MIEVGDKVTEYSYGLGGRYVGEVVSIHPQNRYYRVKFQFEKESFIEAFPMVKLKENNGGQQ